MSLIRRTVRYFSLLRSREANPTAGGRAQLRNARILLTAVSLAATQGTSIVVSLITVPVALRYLGAERYGLWLGITSVMAILRFADLGVGNGLVNTLAKAQGEQDVASSRTYVSSGFFMLASLGLLGLVVFALAYPFVDWAAAFAAKTPVARSEAGPTLFVLMACIAANLPAGVVQRLQAARQAEYVSCAWTIAGSFVGLGGVVMCAWLEAPLPWLVLSASGALVVAAVCNTLFEFFRGSPELRPRLRYFSRRHARELFRVGLLFVLIQVTGIALVACDNLIISHMLGPESVPAYAVPLRLFQIAPLLAGFVLRPIWPAYAEARARGDAPWIRTTFLRSVLLALAASVPLSVALIFAGPAILTAWVGPDALGPSDPSLLVALGAWSILGSLGGAVSMFMNGMDLVRFQAYAGALTGAVALVLKVVLTRQLGVAGVAWGMVVAHALLFLLPSAFAVRTRLK